MILERLRRRLSDETPSRDPTPRQAYERLAEGFCIYSGLSACSSRPRRVGLRGRDDDNIVLACKAHTGALWALPARRLDELERHLVRAFIR